MKKIFLQAYLTENLGDDLFIDIISKRYPNSKMKILTYNNIKTNFSENIKIYNKKYHKLLNKIIKVYTKNKSNLENEMIKKSDITCFIGGSMFIEKSNQNIKNQYFIGKKHYVIGTNFGPYHTKNYYQTFYNMFKKAIDVCFRDEYSYNLFKDLPNVRMAPDIVFSLDTTDLNNKEENKVIISVINCNNRKIENNKEQYESKIIEMINLFQSKGYKVTLMSFCKFEGDENAIERIITQVKNVDKYYYKGNIEEALNILASSKIIVGTRFHANILGLVMNKTIIPIAYSDKTLNVLKDINFKGKIFDIRDMDNFDVNSISDKDLKYKCNVDKQKKLAEKHFEKLDLILKENNNE